MKWIKRLLLLFVLLTLLLAAVPFFVSVDDYRPQIEKLLSARIKEPVRLKSMKLAGLPLPHLVIDGVEIGNADVKVGRITVRPNLLSLLTSVKVIDSVYISELSINRAAIARIPLWAQSGPKTQSADFTVLVRSVRLDDAVLQLQKSTLGPFDARISVAATGLPEQAEITARDGKFRATIKPDAEKFNIEVQAKGWHLPEGPALLFDELLIKGVATVNDVNFSEIKARMYGGTVTGSTTISWQKGLQLKGSYRVSDVELRDLVPLVSPGTRLSGRLTAKPLLSAAAADFPRLQKALKLETPFDIRKGVLQGIDIQKAATSLMTRNSGGETRFDVLSGHFSLERGTQKITKIKVASGSLAASGNVTIAPSKALSGRIDAKVSLVGGTAAIVPLNISGTLDSPLALPTGGAVAGGALGTAILPGVGTAIGTQAGSWVEGLFGSKKK